MNNYVVKTDRGWVDLSNLVYNNKSVNWSMSIGKTVDFKYDDIVSTLTIVERSDDIQYVYIDVPGYVNHHKIYVGQIRHGQLGKVVKRITPDFKHEIGDVINGLLIIDRYRAPGYKYYCYRCLNDDSIGNIREDHLDKGHGCPLCNNSIGENYVANYLIKHEIKFLPQHSFENCKYKRELHFDFYLPEYNACIEYDGLQHFEPVDFAGRGKEWARKQFNNTLLCDEIKNNYCINNGILLCRIKYTQDIAKTLNDFFNNLPINTK